jgi:hypothetical protein
MIKSKRIKFTGTVARMWEMMYNFGWKNFKVTLRPTVNRPVSLGIKPLLGPKTRFLLLPDSCGFVEVKVRMKKQRKT